MTGPLAFVEFPAKCDHLWPTPAWVRAELDRQLLPFGLRIRDGWNGYSGDLIGGAVHTVSVAARGLEATPTGINILVGLCPNSRHATPYPGKTK